MTDRVIDLRELRESDDEDSKNAADWIEEASDWVAAFERRLRKQWGDGGPADELRALLTRVKR